MFLKNVTFNHKINNVNLACGISKSAADNAAEAIIFTTIINAIDQYENYDKKNIEAPEEVATKTADLEAALKYINNEEEYSFLLLHFFEYQRAAVTTFKIFLDAYDKDRRSQMDEDQRVKAEILRKMLAIKDLIDSRQHDDDDNEDKLENSAEETLNPTAIINRIKLIKKSNGDYKTYRKLLSGDDVEVAPPDPTRDVDAYLDYLLSKKKDEDADL